MDRNHRPGASASRLTTTPLAPAAARRAATWRRTSRRAPPPGGLRDLAAASDASPEPRDDMLSGAALLEQLSCGRVPRAAADELLAGFHHDAIVTVLIDPDTRRVRHWRFAATSDFDAAEEAAADERRAAADALGTLAGLGWEFENPRDCPVRARARTRGKELEA